MGSCQHRCVLPVCATATSPLLLLPVPVFTAALASGAAHAVVVAAVARWWLLLLILRGRQ